MSSKSSNTSKQTTQQTTTPTVDPRLDAYNRQLMDLTNAAIGSVDRSPLSGRAIAGQNSFDTQGIASIQQLIAALQPQVGAGTFTQNALDAASGKYLDPATNPTLPGMIEAITRSVMRNLTENIIPGIDTTAIMDNAFGGDRAALTRGVAGARANKDILDNTSRLVYDNYNRERQIQLMAPELFGAGLSAELALPNLISMLGDRTRMFDQMDIDNEIMTRALNEQFAFAGLGPGAQILGSMAPQYTGSTSSGTSTGTSTQTTKQNPLTSVIQGGLGIGSMMAGLGWAPFAGKTAGALSLPKLPTSDASMFGASGFMSPGMGGVTPSMLAPQPAPDLRTLLQFLGGKA